MGIKHVIKGVSEVLLGRRSHLACALRFKLTIHGGGDTTGAPTDENPLDVANCTVEVFRRYGVQSATRLSLTTAIRYIGDSVGESDERMKRHRQNKTYIRSKAQSEVAIGMLRCLYIAL
jgi:hypothetical protein